MPITPNIADVVAALKTPRPPEPSKEVMHPGDTGDDMVLPPDPGFMGPINSIYQVAGGPQMPQAGPPPTLSARIDDEMDQAWREKRKHYEDPAMLNGLAHLGIAQRHQGMYPPAQYPDHYDFNKPLK